MVVIAGDVLGIWILDHAGLLLLGHSLFVYGVPVCRRFGAGKMVVEGKQTITTNSNAYVITVGIKNITARTHSSVL